MAIKVLDVEGAGYLDEDPLGKTQDIIMTNSPSFAPANAGLALSGVKTILGPWWEKAAGVVAVAAHSLTGVVTFLKSLSVSPNVLEEMYFSGAPFAFGEHETIKWHARPGKTITSVIPDKPGKNFLSKQLKKDLSENDVSFDLFVQFHDKEETEPIDDTSVIWKTKFEQVATILLPKQYLNTTDQKELDRKITFSPGHSIVEHEPRGSLNQVRRIAYRQLAKERLTEHPPVSTNVCR